jgi:hypothetical protein
MRALLYRNFEANFVPTALSDANGNVAQADTFQSFIEQIQKQQQPAQHTIQWSSDAADAETFHAIPLTGPNNQLLAVLLVGSSQTPDQLVGFRTHHSACRRARRRRP